MPEITVEIGGKGFAVVCQDGEEAYLHTAAALLDREAAALVSQIGRLPEARMLLMAGLMLADRTAAYEERALAAEGKLALYEQRIAELEARPAPEPKRIEVPVIPTTVTESLSELAARAETLADLIEEKTSA